MHHLRKLVNILRHRPPLLQMKQLTEQFLKLVPPKLITHYSTQRCPSNVHEIDVAVLDPQLGVPNEVHGGRVHPCLLWHSEHPEV
jgi:hypothetical protein